MATVVLFDLNGNSSKIKKSAAELLRRRLLACRESAGVYRRIAVRTARHTEARFVVKAKPYIPDRLPSPELPGIKFKETQAIKQLRLESKIVAIRKLTDIVRHI